uniref:DNA repair protein REV1 n=1 Tax=Culex tarsalis TaxID=7177 RepID=A0A1Q3EYU1_CULTA
MKRKEKFASETGFEGWGDYMDAKISKLEDQFRHNAANVELKLSSLFEGISIFVNGYTKPSAEELKRLMMQHGGTFHHYKRPTTTYVIASNLPDVKVKSITSDIILNPGWIVDCIAQNRIVDYKPYLLYTNHKPSQPKLAFGRLDKQEDLRKPVIKPEGKDDINRDEFMNLMSKLHVLNEQMKADRPEPSSIEQSEPTCDLDSTAKMEEQILAGSPEVFESDVPEQPPEPAPIKPEAETKKSDSRTALVATDPNFLPEFFAHSRLHHIATLGSGFKQYVSELREGHDGKFPARDGLAQQIGAKSDEFEPTASSAGPFIMHIDMDCFFVSVGLRKHPELRGQPVAVTHSKGSEAGTVQARPGQDRAKEIELYRKRLEERYKTPDIPYESRLLNVTDNNSMAEIASCSYEARQKGVKNGMFVGSALKLCPELKTIPYDFEGYKEVAFALYNTVAKYTLNIEAVSCDEMFVDLSELISSTGVDVMDFVSFVRAQIMQETGCPCSAGVGANRLQARMATKRAKPNGQFYLAPDGVEEYMRDIAIGELPGIGPSTGYRLKQLGFGTCGDLQNVAVAILQREFGRKFGDMIYQACRGADERPLVYDKVRKSVSVDVNYGIRFKEEVEVERFMKQLSEEIHKRLGEIKQRGKLVTVKLLVRSPEAPVETAKYMGHGLCDVITKSQPLKEYSSDLEVIQRAVLGLMKQIAAPPHELRGIGLQISKFEEKKSHVETKNSLKSLFQKVEAKNATAPKKEPSPVKLVLTPKKHEVTPTKATSSPSTPKASPRRTESKPKPQPPKFGRGRGRPPKYLTLNKSKQTNDMTKFLKDSKADGPKNPEPIPEGLDPEVLAALPDDIRAEVIKDYKFQAKLQKASVAPAKQPAKVEQESPPQQPSTSGSKPTPASPKSDKICVDFKFLQALPPELRLEVERQIELQKDTMIITSTEPEFEERLQVTPEPSPVKAPSTPEQTNEHDSDQEEAEEENEEENVLLRPNWRQLLTSWVESANAPEPVDVDMIAAGACDLIERKMLYELQQALRLLNRTIEEQQQQQEQAGGCGWHGAYYRIVERVQVAMVASYGTKLAVPKGFECGECCNVKGEGDKEGRDG